MPRRKRESNIVAVGKNTAHIIETLRGLPATKYGLRLYIAGSNQNSSQAIQRVRELCRLMHPSKCDLEIIDLYQQPALAKKDDILASPALVKTSPLPRRTFIGDLSDLGKVLTGLGIIAKNKDARIESKGQ